MAKRIVIHKQIYVPTPFGSGEMNTTLCRRVRNDSDDYNNTQKYEEVTCKFCLGLMHRKDIISLKEYIERKNDGGKK